jgi:hypothetical protein
MVSEETTLLRSYRKQQCTGLYAFVTTNYVHAVTTCSIVLLEKPIVAQLSRNLSPFMEGEGSSSCSQKPTTGCYIEPDKSNPEPPKLFT